MKLVEWIEKTGSANIAKQLGCSQARVINWRLKIAAPSCKMMIEIVKLTKGKVSYKEIVEGFYGQDSNKKLPKKC